MLIWLPTILTGLAIVASSGLGAAVLTRGRGRPAHRALAAVCLNMALWGIMIIGIIHSSAEIDVRRWMAAALIVAAFMPATFYTFVGYVPYNRFQGSRIFCAILWTGAVLIAASALLTPWQTERITLHADRPPTVEHGPLLAIYGLFLGTAFVVALVNLVRKLRRATGQEKRQVQHVLFGIYVYSVLSIATNVLAPLVGIESAEPYGPAFMTIMIAWFAYAIVRYHLLDISIIISRTTVYLALTAFTGLVFFGSVTLMHWGSAAQGPRVNIITSLAVGFFIAVVLQPLRERLQLAVDRVVLKRRYDLQGLVARISRESAEIIKLDKLLETVANDISRTIGAEPVRILLLDDKSPNELYVEQASRGGHHLNGVKYQSVLDELRDTSGPLLLEKLLHSPDNKANKHVIEELRALDANLCIPLRSTSGLVGILTLGPKTSKDIYTREDIHAFMAVAGPLATAIENGRLYRQLQAANLHRAGILSSMRGGVITVDRDGRVTLVNRSAIATFGPIDLGQHMSTLPEQLRELLTLIIEERRDIREFETVIQTPDGETAYLVISAACLSDPDGDMSGAMVMVYDLTELKRLEQNAERADRLSSLGTLAAGMAHEIKNPLASIRSFSQMLPRRHDDPDFLATFSEIVPHEVDRIDSIVSRLLDFARPTQAQHVAVDLRRVFEKVLALVANQASKAGAVIERDWPDEPLLVRGDEQQLVQVFLNLVLNALQSLDITRPGRITISARMDALQVRRKGLAPILDVDCICVTLRDNGKGIPSDIVDHLFTPFFTTKENGTGLGLSVVHGIVSEHGGAIDVSSTPDLGAEFTVSLPLTVSPISVEQR